MRWSTTFTGLLILVLSPCAPVLAADDEPEFTDEFPLADCNFTSTGGNPFFRLKPGRQSYFSNISCLNAGDCDELEEVWITVLPETRKITLPIDGKKRTIETRVVEERETADGKLVEISRNFFANCRPMRDVYYFGEKVDIYKNGKIVSHEGQWQAGKNGARPGIIMPESAFILGQRYFQEIAAGVALDRAEHVAAGQEVEVPAGVFEDCVEVTETTPLSPDSESTKVYCPGVGLVIDSDLELMAVYGGGHGGDDNKDD